MNKALGSSSIGSEPRVVPVAIVIVDSGPMSSLHDCCEQWWQVAFWLLLELPVWNDVTKFPVLSLLKLETVWLIVKMKTIMVVCSKSYHFHL